MSAEPLLGLIDLACRRWLPPTLVEHIAGYADGRIVWNDDRGPWIDLVIGGGESQNGARPVHVFWVRHLQRTCKNRGVPFFFKQWGEWLPAGQVDKDGFEWAPKSPPDHDVHWWSPEPPYGEPIPDGACSIRVGKKQAGRTLDGRTWDQRPPLDSEPAKEAAE